MLNLNEYEYTLSNGWQTAVHWGQVAKRLQREGLTASSDMPRFALKASFMNWHIWRGSVWCVAQLVNGRFTNHEYFENSLDGLAQAVEFVKQQA